MSNILKVTSPIGGYENGNNIKMNPTANAEVQGVQAPITPQKVSRPGGRDDAGQNSTQLKLNYESNFNHFIKLLNNSPDQVEDLMRLLMEKKELLVQAGMNKGTAEDIARFFSMIGLKEGNMSAFLKEQADMGIRYRGPFFDLLRQVFNNTDSVDLKAGLLDFVRRYGDMASGGHIMQSISELLEKCREQMFSKSAGELERMAARLKTGEQHVNGDTQKNAALLKEKILPFLNKYISATHDRGLLRQYTAHLAYQLARYENGSMDGLMQTFGKLMGFQGFKKVFGSMDEALIESVLRKASQADEGWNKEFLNILRSGMNGDASTEGKMISQNFVHSMLLNESVYMPVLHLMLPMMVDGRLMYSELWVDPDDKGAAEDDEEDGRVVKALIKFDIEKLGFFDMFFVYKNGKMDMQLDFPDNLKGKEKEIRQNINRIMAENGIRLQNLVTGSSQESIPITEAFPKIYERKNGVNVRV